MTDRQSSDANLRQTSLNKFIVRGNSQNNHSHRDQPYPTANSKSKPTFAEIRKKVEAAKNLNKSNSFSINDNKESKNKTPQLSKQLSFSQKSSGNNGNAKKTHNNSNKSNNNNSDDDVQSLELQYEMEEDENNNDNTNNNNTTTASSLDPTQKLSYDKEEENTQELNSDELAELEKDNRESDQPTQPKLLKELTAQLSDADMFASGLKNLVVDPLDKSVKYKDAWDNFHVKLPCSPQNTYSKVTDINKKLSKWDLIINALNQDITSSYDLEEVILTYNPSFKNKWNFKGLHDFCAKALTDDEKTKFFNSTLPFIKEVAMQLPSLVKKPIPLLMPSFDNELLLSQYQICSLLANAFLCTFPRRSQSTGEYSNYPSINFTELFMPPCDTKKQGKFRCILQYFDRMSEKISEGNVSFHRQTLNDFPKWSQSKNTIPEIKISTDGTIEDDGINMLQVDFANKIVGGGVLGHGCVQEEIRFLINTELIISRLFTAKLESNECLIVKGAERFANYYGYGTSFQFAGEHRDSTPRDSMQRINTTIVAIDALYFSRPAEQYKAFRIKRELNKAYCGYFIRENDTTGQGEWIATGNWGCGVFNGDKELKSIIQLMAAAEVHRPLYYCTFGNQKFADKLKTCHELLTNGKHTVSEIWSALKEYQDVAEGSGSTLSVFAYLDARLS
jgi:poly(ADP-ribose) glycohydrolase